MTARNYCDLAPLVAHVLVYVWGFRQVTVVRRTFGVDNLGVT